MRKYASTGDKKQLLLNSLPSVLCQFEACAKIQSQAVSRKFGKNPCMGLGYGTPTSFMPSPAAWMAVVLWTT